MSPSVSASSLLDPIGLSHYAPALLKNLSSDNGRTLSVQKMSTIKMSHLGQMNITNFQDQKEIIRAMRLALTSMSTPDGNGGDEGGRNDRGGDRDRLQQKTTAGSNRRSQRR